MKNNLITRMAFSIFLSFLGGLGSAQTTSLDVGTVKNGVAAITNLANANHVLIANLPERSTVSELKLEYSGYEGKYYLTAKVSNSAVSSVGIQLVLTGSNLAAFAGSGVEITCNGYNCGDCRITFAKMHPLCKCLDPNPGTDFRCDMSSRVTIGL